jgi:putative exosortase-associated protein (TIGR04073 family)
MKKHLFSLVIVGILFVIICSTMANGQNPSSLDDEFGGVPVEAIVDRMGKKLFRGIVNIATGWAELPRQFELTSRHEGVLAAFPVGLFKGAIMVVIRTGVGGYDVITFVSASPGDFDSLLDPQFVWETRNGDYVSGLW